MTLQTLQTIYYILGIIVMVLGLLFLIALTVFVFYIKCKIDSIHDQIENRLDTLFDQVIRPAETAIGVGSAVASSALSAAKRITKKKPRTSRKK